MTKLVGELAHDASIARKEQPLALVLGVTDQLSVFEQAGFEIVVAADATQAIALLASSATDIVVIGMAGMNGEAASDRLSVVEASCAKSRPVVVLTDGKHGSDVERAYQAGATDVWLATAGPEILKRRLQFLLEATRAFAELHRSSAKLERAQRLARFATWEWNLQSDHVHWSSELRQLLESYGPDATGIDAVLEMVHPAERTLVQRQISEALERQVSFSFDHRVARNDNSELVLHQEAEVRLDDTGAVVHIDGFAVDVTALKRAEVQIHTLANYDPVTGLPNRVSFLERVGDACERVVRRPGSVAVALMDIDRFKDVNEGLGHSVGDQLLRDIAERLGRSVRKGDLVARENDSLIARRGGDEFLMLLSDVDEAHHAAIAARRILDSVSRPFRVAGKEIHITGSIGIAVSELATPKPDDLVRHAEIAMYRAKEAGGNTFQFFDAPMHRNVLERFDTENRLRRAMARKELTLFYQPLVHTRSRSFAGVEALLRWNHPTRGLLTADTFVPLAEETGLIVPIGRWVLRTACEQLKKWSAEGYGSMRLAVNLSPRELRAAGLVATLAKILEETGVQPGQLEIEITERGVMQNDEVTLDVLLRLQKMGVRLAVDDFGTGHTTFHYLKNFPLNTLKIDKSFTQGIAIDGKDAAITKALLAMAHRLELNVVAEGVENEAQMSFLGEHLCDEVQGYLFGKPIPASELARALERYDIAV